MVTSEQLKRSVVSDKGLAELRLENNPLILVVDDEALIREVAVIMVEDNGGRVLTAATGEEAVEVFREKAEEIDYVCMDFSMPGLNGHEAFLEMEKIRPDVKVVFVSGLKITPEVQELHRAGRVEFLSKPFHEVELLKAIGRLKDR